MSHSFRVFAQRAQLEPDEFTLITQARHHFGAEFSFVQRHFTSVSGQPVVRLTIDIQLVGHGSSLVTATIRACVPADYEAAERAEKRGKAGGMSTLARRCPTLWEVDAESVRHALTLCGSLALVNLGPVLLSDESTLFGVRGARERLEKLDKK